MNTYHIVYKNKALQEIGKRNIRFENSDPLDAVDNLLYLIENQWINLKNQIPELDTAWIIERNSTKDKILGMLSNDYIKFLSKRYVYF